MKGDAFKLAQLSGEIQSVGVALGVIDAASGQLDIADQAVSLFPAMHGSKDAVATGISILFGSEQDLQQGFRDSIAQARVDLQRYRAFYVGYTADDSDQEISTAHSMGIASSLQFVNKTLNNVIDAANDGPTVSAIDLVNAVAQVIATAIQLVGNAAQSVLQAAANTTAGIVSAFSWPLAIAGAGVVLVVLWRNGFLKGGA